MKTKTKIPHLILAGLFSATIASQGATILSIGDALGSRLIDTAQNGSGNSLSAHSLNVGTKANGAGWDMHAGLAFQMTGAADGYLEAANFSTSYTGGQGTPIYNVDVYVNRVSSSLAFQTSDYENGTKIMDDFVTTSDIGSFGTYSLDATGQANLLSYLQSNWVEGDYLYISLKANTDPAPLIMGEDANANYVFGSWLGGDNSDALLIVTVPEPSSTALLGLGLSSMLLRRRRS